MRPPAPRQLRSHRLVSHPLPTSLLDSDASPRRSSRREDGEVPAVPGIDRASFCEYHVGAPTQTRRAAAAALAALEYVRAAASLCSLKRKASTVVRLTAGVRRQAWIMVPRAMPLAVFRLPSCFVDGALCVDYLRDEDLRLGLRRRGAAGTSRRRERAGLGLSPSAISSHRSSASDTAQRAGGGQLSAGQRKTSGWWGEGRGVGGSGACFSA